MLVAGHHDVGIGASLCQKRQKRRIQERHVAAHDEYLFGWRLHERRVETAQRSCSGDPIDHDPGTFDPASRSVAFDDQDMWGQVAQQ